MGKTYKDQKKWDKKREKESDGISKIPSKRANRKPHEEIIPEGDVLDPYEELDYDDDHYR